MTPELELELRRAINSSDPTAELNARRKLKLSGEMSHPVGVDYGELAPSEVDIKTGAPWGTRSAASVKITPQGKKGYLESVYGQGNVRIRQDGEFFFRKSPEKQWTQFDESALTMRDFADMAGGAMEAVPPIGAGMFTLNPLAMGAAAAGGNVARQAASEILPGEEGMGLGERALRVGATGMLGAGAQAGSNVLFKGVDVLRPHNIVARQVQKSMLTPLAREGRRVEGVVGGFSPGQQTGSRAQLMAEGVARQMPSSADDVFKFDQGQATAAVNTLTRLMAKITPEPSGAITTGSKISGAFNNALDKTLKTRSSQARIDFGKVDQLSGGVPVFKASQTRATIQQLVDEFDVPGGGDATATLVNKLRGILPKLQPPRGKPLTSVERYSLVSRPEPAEEILTANQMQRMLQIYGNAAKGSGQIFKDIDTGQQRMIAARIFGALQRDIDDVVGAGGQGGAAVEALALARNNYKANSQYIDELSNSVLGRVFGGKYDPAPEALAEKFLKMHPSEVRASVDIIGKSDPATVQSLKRFILEEGMSTAKPAQTALGAPGFSPAKFNSFISKQGDRLQAIMNPKEFGEIKRISGALSRITDRAGMQGSQTGPFLMMWDAIKGVFTFNPVALGRTAATAIAPKKIASAMMTPEGRRALLTVTQTSRQTKASVAAVAYLTGKWAIDDANELYSIGADVEQQNQLQQQPQLPQQTVQ